MDIRILRKKDDVSVQSLRVLFCIFYLPSTSGKVTRPCNPALASGVTGTSSAWGIVYFSWWIYSVSLYLEITDSD